MWRSFLEKSKKNISFIVKSVLLFFWDICQVVVNTFCKSRDVANKRTCINGNHENKYYCHPSTNPKSECHIINFSSQTKFVNNCFKHQHRSSGAENSEWLSTTESIKNSTYKTGHQRFHSCHIIASCGSQKSAKCDNR